MSTGVFVFLTEFFKNDFFKRDFLEIDFLLTDGRIIFRLLVSFFAGSFIGLERSIKRQAAGLRTHILICIGATGVMVLSLWLTQKNAGGDPGRIAAQVVSGMGFLGGGAILKYGANVKGLTTAASIWVVACIGLVIGCGMYVAAGTLVFLTLATLSAMDFVEQRFFPAHQNKFLEIQFTNDEIRIAEIEKILKKHGIAILSTDVKQFNGKENRDIKEGNDTKESRTAKDITVKLLLFISMPKRTNIKTLISELKDIGTVKKMALTGKE